MRWGARYSGKAQNGQHAAHQLGMGGQCVVTRQCRSGVSTAHRDFLLGANSYKLHLPKSIPAALFWSVTIYDPVTGSELDNGQSFPSINTMAKPETNADGSIDIYFGPSSPGQGKNWLKTLPDKGFFVIPRLYSPTKAFFDQSWKPSDIEKVQ
jgi:hypothetical protein